MYDKYKEKIKGWWTDKEPTIKATFNDASTGITQVPGHDVEEGEEDEQKKVENTWEKKLFVDNSLASSDGTDSHPIICRFNRLFSSESICRRSGEVRGDYLTINPEKPVLKS